ncbi:immunoglobulin superfamily member 6 isoform X1 [Mirounga angustirostris]|uniref:immunoglobulin superfamily member 6 isoform X1 n=1 Tax=Mirounga leonina TaxID=9715 RepID=UPI00156C274D|nr:immunoglobulin superfamily member 6 isoform X1 [Mirounga leonina]XP_045731097.1 immunoglobulin superfamily member 6 isoform X1 [Mirounga angustirostris]
MSVKQKHRQREVRSPLNMARALPPTGATRECMVFVHQPPYLEVAHNQGTATIQCSFSHTGCPSKQPQSLWFRYGADQPENLCVDGCTGDAGKFTVKEFLTERAVSLTVNRVALNDSAIYICGIVFPKLKEPGAKRTGEGTILVVREMKEPHSLLIAVVSLLSIYIIGALVIFVILSKSKSNSLRNKETGDSQKKRSARRIFQEIAQELYSKRQVETRQQPVSVKYQRDVMQIQSMCEKAKPPTSHQ